MEEWSSIYFDHEQNPSTISDLLAKKYHLSDSLCLYGSDLRSLLSKYSLPDMKCLTYHVPNDIISLYQAIKSVFEGGCRILASLESVPDNQIIPIVAAPNSLRDDVFAYRVLCIPAPSSSSGVPAAGPLYAISSLMPTLQKSIEDLIKLSDSYFGDHAVKKAKIYQQKMKPDKRKSLSDPTRRDSAYRPKFHPPSEFEQNVSEQQSALVKKISYGSTSMGQRQLKRGQNVTMATSKFVPKSPTGPKPESSHGRLLSPPSSVSHDQTGPGVIPLSIPSPKSPPQQLMQVGYSSLSLPPPHTIPCIQLIGFLYRTVGDIILILTACRLYLLRTSCFPMSSHLEMLLLPSINRINSVKSIEEKRIEEEEIKLLRAKKRKESRRKVKKFKIAVSVDSLGGGSDITEQPSQLQQSSLPSLISVDGIDITPATDQRSTTGVDPKIEQITHLDDGIASAEKAVCTAGDPEASMEYEYQYDYDEYGQDEDEHECSAVSDSSSLRHSHTDSGISRSLHFLEEPSPSGPIKRTVSFHTAPDEIGPSARKLPPIPRNKNRSGVHQHSSFVGKSSAMAVSLDSLRARMRLGISGSSSTQRTAPRHSTSTSSSLVHSSANPQGGSRRPVAHKPGRTMFTQASRFTSSHRSKVIMSNGITADNAQSVFDISDPVEKRKYSLRKIVMAILSATRIHLAFSRRVALTQEKRGVVIICNVEKQRAIHKSFSLVNTNGSVYSDHQDHYLKGKMLPIVPLHTDRRKTSGVKGMVISVAGNGPDGSKKKGSTSSQFGSSEGSKGGMDAAALLSQQTDLFKSPLESIPMSIWRANLHMAYPDGIPTARKLIPPKRPQASFWRDSAVKLANSIDKLLQNLAIAREDVAKPAQSLVEGFNKQMKLFRQVSARKLKYAEKNSKWMLNSAAERDQQKHKSLAAKRKRSKQVQADAKQLVAHVKDLREKQRALQKKLDGAKEEMITKEIEIRKNTRGG
ncbi:hypothetical protein ADUPG1_009533 [Aduncisulcus paluster]|uniref:Uncharacterized protein n=1 Tax=Aduncisulcus paluster TaxID=2918883 RepID=A0ABQ5KVY4_9EUKA|nr:hypothetical protein ADUPG1_009533 [Aduncisulcus paluster]